MWDVVGHDDVVICSSFITWMLLGVVGGSGDDVCHMGCCGR